MDEQMREARDVGIVSVMREPFIWDLANPAATLAEILDQSMAVLGDVVVGYVDMETQCVTGTRIVTLPPPADDTGRHPIVQGELDRLAVSRTLHEVATELAAEREWIGDRWAKITGVLITVVCRSGYVVDSAADWRWLMGWRYANHNRDAFDGDVYIVTPHGWTGVLDERCGLSPTAGHPQPALRAVPAT